MQGQTSRSPPARVVPVRPRPKSCPLSARADADFDHYDTVTDLSDECVDLMLNCRQAGTQGSRSKVYMMVSLLLSGAMRRQPDHRPSMDWFRTRKAGDTGKWTPPVTALPGLATRRSSGPRVGPSWRVRRYLSGRGSAGAGRRRRDQGAVRGELAGRYVGAAARPRASRVAVRQARRDRRECARRPRSSGSSPTDRSGWRQSPMRCTGRRYGNGYAVSPESCGRSPRSAGSGSSMACRLGSPTGAVRARPVAPHRRSPSLAQPCR
jgi:hypothetical protein